MIASLLVKDFSFLMSIGTLALSEPRVNKFHHDKCYSSIGVLTSDCSAKRGAAGAPRKKLIFRLYAAAAGYSNCGSQF